MLHAVGESGAVIGQTWSWAAKLGSFLVRVFRVESQADRTRHLANDSFDGVVGPSSHQSAPWRDFGY
jgi:hypothetical protein